MRQRISLLLAVLILAGTLSLPTLAAEPGEDNARETGAQNGGVQQVPADPEETQDPRPDPEGTVTWANLDSRIREGSLSALILAENIGGIEGIDYDLMYDDLRRQINDIADLQWMMVLMGNSMGADALDQTYDALRETFDAIKDGELQADNADVVWQLEDTVNQVVSGGETLYITLLGLEQQAADGQRGLAALDRSLEELRLRQTLGQVSQQTVAQLEQTRVETVSQLNSLDATIRELKVQLQNLIGEVRPPPESWNWALCLPGRRQCGRSPTMRPAWRPPRRPAGPCAVPRRRWRMRKRIGRTPAPTTAPPASSTCSSRRSIPGTPLSSPTSPQSRTSRPASKACMTPWPTMSSCMPVPSPLWFGSSPSWTPFRPAMTWG